MQDLPSRPSFEKIALKWHDLAQRRLDYYTELYRSGRWELYYTQDRFAVRMLDVINAAKSWRDLAGYTHELSLRLDHPQQPPQPERDGDKLRTAA